MTLYSVYPAIYEVSRKLRESRDRALYAPSTKNTIILIPCGSIDLEIDSADEKATSIQYCNDKQVGYLLTQLKECS